MQKTADLFSLEVQPIMENLQLRLQEATGIVKKEKVDLQQVKTVVAKLKKSIANLKKVKSEFVSAFKKAKDATELPREYNETSKVLIEAENTLCELDVLIETQEQETVKANAKPEGNQSTQVNIKLPKLEITKFDGDITRFCEFWESFDTSIHQADMPNIRKFKYLRSYLTDSAAEEISGLSLTDKNYLIAIDLLKNRYGDQKAIINKHYASLRSLKRAENNTANLRTTLSHVEKHLRSLEMFGEDTDHSSLLSIIYEKFPKALLLKVDEIVPEVNMKSLRSTLNQIITSRERFDGLESSSEDKSNKTTFQRSNKAFKATSFGKTGNDNNNHEQKKTDSQLLKCKFCTGQHYSDECTVVTSLSARKEKVRHLCQLCLNGKHEITQCKKLNKPCYHCKIKSQHHQSLCPTKFEDKPTENKNSGSQRNKANTGSSNSTTTVVSLIREVASLLSAEVNCKNNETVRLVLSLLDTCSGKSYITENLCRVLKLKPLFYEEIDVNQFGGTQIKMSVPVVMLCIQLIDDTFFTLPVRVVPKIVDSPGKRITPAQYIQNNPLYREFKLADSGKITEADLLIGNDYLFDLFLCTKVQLKENLYLIASKLGWLLAGRTTETEEIKNDAQHCLIARSDNDAVKHLWSLETLGILEETDEKEEDKALTHFYENVQYEDGIYTVSWPWRQYPPELPTNFSLAFGQLKSLVKRLDDDTLRDYHNNFMNQLEQGIIEKAPPTAELVHYMPHHGVFTPEKTTPLRIVFNGSAKTTKKNISLNDSLLKGKSLMTDSLALIIRLRMHAIGITADIEKAFLQVNLHTQDRDVVRFLWLKDFSKPVEITNLEYYRFTRIPFGVISSPFLLNITMHLHLQKNPVISKICEDFYVDNLVTGTKTEEEAIRLYQISKSVFQAANMNLRMWTSNSQPVKEKFENDACPESQVNILGLNWCTQNDVLSIKEPKFQPPEHITKRIVLKYTASIYDPVGFFAPILLNAKLFIKQLWMKKYEWDDVLEEEDRKIWLDIQQQIKTIFNQPIPRYVGGGSIYQWHIYTDASKQAYAVVAYIRIEESKTEEVKVNFVTAKARVTPMREITIPRLELIGLMLGVRLLKFLQKTVTSMEYQFRKPVLWTDSKCVLSWIQSTKVLPLFVQRRRKEITSVDAEFRYISTEENPADIATRSCTLDEFNSSLWWTAPHSLHKNEENWPSKIIIDDTYSEEEIQVTTLLTFETKKQGENEIFSPFHLDITRFSSFKTLIGTTAYCFKAIELFKKQERKSDAQHTTEAEEQWLLYDQEMQYGDFNMSPENEKTMKTLKPFKDNQGILRCTGRLRNASVTYDMENPILLAPKSHLTKLLVLQIHQENFHCGTAQTLATIRQRYWLPKGRKYIASIVKKNCLLCRKHLAKPYKLPPIAPLPEYRITKSAFPFERIGMDVFGPFLVATSTLPKAPKKKRWILLFTCLVVRAVHLEVLETLHASAFLHAFRRFVALRGTPTLVVTDNASQFYLLDRVITELWKIIKEDDTVTAYFAHQRIEWKFLPDYASWMGGVYERLVGITKKAYKRTSHLLVFSDRQLVTLTAEIAAMLNARPLIYLPEEIDAPILTPNHFLQRRFSAIPITDQEANNQCSFTPATETVSKIWRKSNEYLNQFWRIWKDSYLLSLRERSDGVKTPYRTAAIPPKIGEIVHILEPTPDRNQWRIATIEKLIYSEDGVVRSVHIRTPKGNLLTRPISKIAPLEIRNTSDTEAHEVHTDSSAETSQQQTVDEQNPAVSYAGADHSSDSEDIIEISWEILSDSDAD